MTYAFLVLSFIKIHSIPYIQIHFQMEIKPSTNSAAFNKKKKKSHPKMNDLDRKTWIRAVSTLRPSKFSKKNHVAWTLCNLISENTPAFKVNNYDKEGINCSSNCTVQKISYKMLRCDVPPSKGPLLYSKSGIKWVQNVQRERK